MENKYTFNSIKDISIRDEDLARLFLIRKTPAEVKAYDATISKLTPKERTKVADPAVTQDAIYEEMKEIVAKNPSEYTNLVNLPGIDVGFIVQNLHGYYKLITRNPRLYKLNLVTFMQYYEALLAENWEVFDRERLTLEKKALQTGIERTISPQSNVSIFNKLSNLIASIDLEKVKSKNSSYEL